MMHGRKMFLGVLGVIMIVMMIAMITGAFGGFSMGLDLPISGWMIALIMVVFMGTISILVKHQN